VLQTVSIGTGSPGSLAYDYTDPLTHVLVRAQDLAYSGSTSLFRVNLTDGSTTQTDFVVYQDGVYSAAVTATPIAKFGPTESCPFFPISFTQTPEVTTTEYLIRRERVFPVVDPNGKRIFFSFLQLILNSGNGITSGQGSDPLVELDWSKDGGHTWSNLHYLRSGAIGAYQTRVIQRRLGQSHNGFVFRVAVTDPVAWSLIQAVGEFTVGTA
jgi:hypothetical protein